MVPTITSYFGLLNQGKKIYRFIRKLIPYKYRWFFEGNLNVPGQLWYVDRKKIYQVVRKHKPKVVFEIGTWYGGGSTYFISQALYENGFGILHTVEIDPKVYACAIENYNRYLKHLLPFIKFYRGNALEKYPEVLKNCGKVDMLFLDGVDDPQQTLLEFEMFAPYLGSKSVVIAHDWGNKKTALLKPKVEASREFTIEEVILLPKSIGLAIFSRK